MQPIRFQCTRLSPEKNKPICQGHYTSWLTAQEHTEKVHQSHAETVICTRCGQRFNDEQWQPYITRQVLDHAREAHPQAEVSYYIS